ncbi:MAG: hypothetical protein WC635_16380 [Bacteriovorax sp.]|jgi:hypothetical protein
MDVDDILIQRIIAVAGLCLWFIFPFGMFISTIRQDLEALPPKKFEDYQMHPPYYEDPFSNVKVETEKEYEEPRINDVSHHSVSINPGPDHKHTEV